jgi:glutamine amidotransferase
MISILDIDHSHSVELADFLKPITSDVKITLVESELLKSDKIIISFSGSIQKAIRKIHLMNLFSALRMISDLPVLGIDSGMHLMCEKVDNFACLAMISGLIVSTEEMNIFHTEGNFSEIVTVSDDLLFYNMKGGSKFFFEKCSFMPRNEFTTSVLKNNTNITSSVRKNNFYGVQFLPQKSGEIGLNVLRNFIDI